MQIHHDDIVGLLHLQDIDIEVLRVSKQLADLPQRGQILEARKKRQAIEEKCAKVAELKKQVEQKIARIADEDASLERKAADVQAAIDAAGGDYRNVEARTKELSGIAKRRDTLAENLEAAQMEQLKVEEVESQVIAALKHIARAEEAAVKSFQEEGGALQNEVARLQKARKEVVEEVDPSAVDLYEKTAARSGGVAVGVLNGNKCGVCRALIDGGRLIDLKSQAPLGTCPACKRLLVIQ